MSIECGECERDLRGGHAISCSHYKLREGVAEAMYKKATGNIVWEDEEFPKEWLDVADVAIAKVREYDEAQKENKT